MWTEDCVTSYIYEDIESHKITRTSIPVQQQPADKRTSGYSPWYIWVPWWRKRMEMSSALLVFREENPWFFSERTNFAEIWCAFFFNVSLDKLLNAEMSAVIRDAMTFMGRYSI